MCYLFRFDFLKIWFGLQFRLSFREKNKFQNCIRFTKVMLLTDGQLFADLSSISIGKQVTNGTVILIAPVLRAELIT